MGITRAAGTTKPKAIAAKKRAIKSAAKATGATKAGMKSCRAKSMPKVINAPGGQRCAKATAKKPASVLNRGWFAHREPSERELLLDRALLDPENSTGAMDSFLSQKNPGNKRNPYLCDYNECVMCGLVPTSVMYNDDLGMHHYFKHFLVNYEFIDAYVRWSRKFVAWERQLKQKLWDCGIEPRGDVELRMRPETLDEKRFRMKIAAMLRRVGYPRSRPEATLPRGPRGAAVKDLLKKMGFDKDWRGIVRLFFRGGADPE
jgi:hypothetical protein